jgi:catechol 2,3-dioxygenase-like lactoylglutathione lyase family enzyme
MAEFPAPARGIALTHFIVSSDVDRARRFYADVLGGEVRREGEPPFITHGST